jgi:hypothetical protein
MSEAAQRANCSLIICMVKKPTPSSARDQLGIYLSALSSPLGCTGCTGNKSPSLKGEKQGLLLNIEQMSV